MIRRWKNRLKFLIERLFLRGAQYRLLVLAMLIGLISVLGGVLVEILDAEGPVSDEIWWAFLRLTDPGYLGDDAGIVRRTVSTILTVLGYVLFMGALIAIMTQWLHAKMRQLESGLTPIAEEGHILILGWTNRTPVIVRELLLSGGRMTRFLKRAGTGRTKIVILAEEVTSSLRQQLRDELGALWDEKGITLRSGTSLRVEHLRRVDFSNAAVIIVPGSDFQLAGTAHTDSRTIKTALTVSSLPEGADRRPLLVCEMRDARKIPIAREAYRGAIQVLASDAVVGSLVAQNIVHPGISGIFHEILTHSHGNEVYIRPIGDFAGREFRDMFPHLQHAIPLGILRNTEGHLRPMLRPPFATKVEGDDLLVVLARSYEEAEPSEVPITKTPPLKATKRPVPRPRQPRCILMLGWSHKSPALLRQLRVSLPKGSRIDVLSSVKTRDRVAQLQRYHVAFPGNDLRHLEGDYTLPQELTDLKLSQYGNIVILASQIMSTEDEADARTVTAYLLLRDLLRTIAPRPRVLVEILDPENAELIKHGHDEVLISSLVLSHMVSQVALRPELRYVFDALFGPRGAEFTLLPAALYEMAGGSISFGEIQRKVAQHGDIALGYRLAGGGPEAERLVLNPERKEELVFGENDEIILLAAGSRSRPAEGSDKIAAQTSSEVS